MKVIIKTCAVVCTKFDIYVLYIELNDLKILSITFDS